MNPPSQTFEIAFERVTYHVRLPGRAQRHLLQDISFSWRSGQSIGLIRPSGSGKTTLLRLLAGLDRPSGGRISRRPRKPVMLVMQRPEDHFSELNVGRQIASYARGVMLPRERAAVLASVGLPADALNWPLRELSSGHQRLVAIACALASATPFLALDEPMAGLDCIGRELVSAALQQVINDQHTAVLIVSHHPDDLLGMIDRLLILNLGQIAYDGPMATVPLSALARCVAEPAQSLLYTLRRFEEGGIRLGDSIYATRDPLLVCERILAQGDPA